MVSRIMCHILTGVTIGVALGAMCLSTLPIWLGVSVIIVVSLMNLAAQGN